MSAVWPDAFVEEANLAQNVSLLRKTLGDEAEDPVFIATIPKRGYRFVAPVRRAGGETGTVPAVTEERANAGPTVAEHSTRTPAPRRAVGRRGLLVLAATAVLVVGMASYLRVMRRPAPASPDVRSIAVLPF